MMTNQVDVYVVALEASVEKLEARIAALEAERDKWRAEASRLFEELTEAQNRLRDDEAILIGRMATIVDVEAENAELRRRMKVAGEIRVESMAEPHLWSVIVDMRRILDIGLAQSR